MVERPIAIVNDCRSPVSAVHQITFDKLAERFGKCDTGPKDGKGIVPADIEVGLRNGERVKSVSFLMLDVEADADPVKDKNDHPVKDKHGDIIKRVIGLEPPAVDEMLAELSLHGWHCVLNTTYSHGGSILPEGVEHPRYRLTFDTSRPLLPAEVKPMVLHVASLLGIADCFDSSCAEPARLFYLPRCPAERLPLFRHGVTEGEPLDVDALLADAKKIEQAQKSAAAGRHGQASGSVIQAFNDAHDAGLLIEQHGYKPKGRNRWIWPSSTTGMPGVRKLPNANSVYSSHNGDPLNDGHAHDAFDCWRILNHGGDMTVAVREAARLLGMEGRKASATASAGGEHQPGEDGAPAGDSSGGARIAPEPLRATLPPAEIFPVQSLGTVLGGAAIALHESVKAPLALCCQSVLAAASFAVQAHVNVKMPWGEVKPSTLFFLTVGESGERKSAIDDLVLGAAKAQERADMAIYSEELKRYQVAAAAHEHAVDAARRSATTGKKGSATQAEVMAAVERCGEKPNAPVAPMRFVTDPTVEGLFKLLVVSQPSVALFSDEGGLLIGGHALNSDNALKTFARWCKLWDGAPFDRVRAGDGAGILYGRRMALHQLAQPDVMVKLLSDRMANGQGLLARCLVAWPATTIGTRHMEQFAWAGDLPAIRRLYAVFKKLLETTPATGDEAGQELTPFELELSPDAKALAVAASNQFETLMASGADLCELRDRTSKALENACRIAGVIAVIEGGLSVRLIESEHLQRALVLMQWYLAEALRIRGAAAIPQSVGDAETLSAWLRDRGLTMFRTKQVLNAGPSQLRNKPRLMSAISELVTGGYLIENGPGMVVDGVSTRKSWEVIHHVV